MKPEEMTDADRLGFEAAGYRCVMRYGSLNERLGAKTRRAWIRKWYRVPKFKDGVPKGTKMPRTNMRPVGGSLMSIWMKAA
jgi:hypothetical protein